MTAHSSSGSPDTLTLQIPSSWQALTEQQLTSLLFIITHTTSAEDVKAQFLLHTLIPPHLRAQFDPDDLVDALDALDWMDKAPDTPVRPDWLGGIAAIDPLIHSLNFEQYLIAENLFQGYIATEDEEPALQLAAILFPIDEKGTPQLQHKAIHAQAALLWWMGIKAHFARTFADLFKPAPASEDGTRPDMEAAMNAQIRALTGGDVTKEDYILHQVSAWRALTELNAKAREAHELQKSLNN